jgi:hypothetical protein
MTLSPATEIMLALTEISNPIWGNEEKLEVLRSIAIDLEHIPFTDLNLPVLASHLHSYFSFSSTGSRFRMRVLGICI